MNRLKTAFRENSTQAWVEIAVLLLLSLLLLWKGVLTGWQKLNTDFPNYYVAARLLREGYSLDRLYDWIWLQRIKDHWGIDQGVVTFNGLTPFSALPLWPLAMWSALTAKRIWILLNLLFLGGAVELLRRETQLSRVRAWILALLMIVPLRSSFAFGQMHLLVLLLLAGAYCMQRRGRPIACGVLLGLAGALKIYPLLFVIFFAWKKKWRELLAIVGCFVAVVVISYVWMGHTVVSDYLFNQLPRSTQGEGMDPYNVHLASASALFHRLFVYEPSLNPFPLIRASWLYSVLYPLWQVVILFPVFAALKRASAVAGHAVTDHVVADQDAEALDWSIFLAVLLLLSPLPGSYHFVVLIAAFLPLVDVLLRRGQTPGAIAVVALYALIGIVGSPVAVSQHFSLAWITSCNRLWLQLLLWALLVWYLWLERDILSALKADRRRAVCIAAPFMAIWLWGIVSTQRHMSGWEQDYTRRITLPGPSPLIATRPVPRLVSKFVSKRSGFLFTALHGNGFAVLDQDGDEVLPDQQADSLTAAARGQMILIESAGKDGSQLTQLPEPTPEMATVLRQLENAESPVISPDGAWIAYLRETRGRGSLWVVHNQGGQGTRATLLELVGRSSDVQDAAFLPSGDLLFTATIEGRRGIYTMPPTRSHGPIAFLVQDDPTSSPAVSPDGHWVAYRVRLHHRWQLAAMELATHTQRVLTEGDCDAHTPAWSDRSTILYATDCGRAIGQTALAKARLDDVRD